jgi:hypothetical protein
MFTRVVMLLCLSATALPGCHWFASPAPPVVVAPAQPKRDLVAEIRVEAAKAGDVLKIEPVQNPRVTVLLQQIELADARGEHRSAKSMTIEAETIEPNNPVVVQFKAESQLRQDSFAMAEVLAQKSYDNSAQVGPLCVRNWLTIAHARAARANIEGEKMARSKALECPLKAVQRL